MTAAAEIKHNDDIASGLAAVMPAGNEAAADQ